MTRSAPPADPIRRSPAASLGDAAARRGTRAFAVGFLVLRLVNPLVLVLLVRSLSHAAFGVYAATIAITTICGLVIDFGLQPGMFAWCREHSPRLALLAGTMMVLVAFVLVSPLALLWSEFTVRAPWPTVEGLLGTLAGTALVGLAASVYQIRARYDVALCFYVAVNATMWCAVLLAVFAGARSTSAYAVGQGVPMVFVGLASVCLVARQTRALNGFAYRSIRWEVLGFARANVSFGMSSALYQGYSRADQAILASVVAPTEVAAYTVAYRSIDLALIVPAVLVNQVLWPRLFARRDDGSDRLRAVLSLTAKTLFGVGCYLALALSLTAPVWVELAFGYSQPRAVEFARILVWVIPLQFLVASPVAALTTQGHMNDRLRAQIAAVALNIVLNVMVVRIWGAVGVAVVMILSALLLLGLALVLAERVVTFRGVWSSFLPIAGLFLAAAVGAARLGQGMGAAGNALILGTGAVLAGLALLVVISPEERRLAHQMLSGPDRPSGIWRGAPES